VRNFRQEQGLRGGSVQRVCASSALLAERRHPPTGRFIEVNGARLHYTDQGVGRAIVLLHGNGVSGDDYKTSSVAPSHRWRPETGFFPCRRLRQSAFCYVRRVR
jgi:hypothetical protein